jgi:hypothetical protein
MKTRLLVSVLILLLTILIAFGSCATYKKTFTQEKPTIEDIDLHPKKRTRSQAALCISFCFSK